MLEKFKKACANGRRETYYCMTRTGMLRYNNPEFHASAEVQRKMYICGIGGTEFISAYSINAQNGSMKHLPMFEI